MSTDFYPVITAFKDVRGIFCPMLLNLLMTGPKNSLTGVYNQCKKVHIFATRLSTDFWLDNKIFPPCSFILSRQFVIFFFVERED
jgi:hypothetical protein